ncbi:ATP-binding protein [Streptomyces uncialis]|uniref:ATP-binding protein n=1 Tax=Streptomyces uncialis TaxID=1048205 RepID=UPI0033F8AF2C
MPSKLSSSEAARSAPHTAFVYVCDPDADTAFADLTGLTDAAERRGYKVRAAVCDTGEADVPLPRRPGWQVLDRYPAAEGPGVLVVGSTGELAAEGTGRRAVLKTLAERGIEVEAVRPSAREVSQWLRIWTRPARLFPSRSHAPPAGGPGPYPRACCVVFPARPEHARAVRTLIAGVLDTWGAGLDEDPGLVCAAAHELVGNAIVHGSWPGGPVTVTVERDHQALRISVGDRSCATPLRRHAGNGDSSGRGLAMVDEISHAWGCTGPAAPASGGKTVWMDVRTRQVPSRTAADGQSRAECLPPVSGQPCEHVLAGRVR